MYKRRADERVLHFKSADDWTAYNKRFGTGDPFGALMMHVHSMAHDIAAMRNLGPNPALGLDYREQLIRHRIKKEDLGLKVDGHFGFFGDAPHAKRMLRLYGGPSAPEGSHREMYATFFSNARHLMTAAFLDRAVVASISDFNSMRLAAQQAGISNSHIFAIYGKTMKDVIAEGTMATEDLLRHQWALDTLADPGATMARFQTEIPPSEVFERLSSASMRLQGLTHHTDTAKFAFQSGFWGAFADQAGRAFDDLDPVLKRSMEQDGIAARDWDALRGGPVYEAGNGATFLNPLYWRTATDLPADQADRISMKFQRMIERWTEVAVPTNSLKGKALFDPVAYVHAPGSLPYEIMKSGGMFKSFVFAFTINQYRMIMMQPTAMSRAMYGLNLAAGATVMGALSLQILEVLKDNDPVDPLSNPEFWRNAALKGGGFGIIGDIVATGQAKWGGGAPSYVAGPVPQAAQDAWKLTVGNAWEFATGQETKAGREFTKLLQRYTPMADNPMVGVAVDRLFFDQLQMVLDPEGRDALHKAAKLRENQSGNAEWWPSASPAPKRPPKLSALLGSTGSDR